MRTFAMLPTDVFPGLAPASPAAFSDPATPILAVLPGIQQLPANLLQEDVLLLPDRLPPAPTRRLLVLLPAGEINETLLARRVWLIAGTSGFSVFYLALARNEVQAAAQRRRLAGLAAMTSDKDIHAQAGVSVQKSWPHALQATLRPGDLIICLADHQAPGRYLRRVALGRQLAETQALPVYLMGGLQVGPPRSWQQRSKTLQSWLVLLLLVGIFFALQVAIGYSTDKPLTTILLGLTIFVELYLLMRVNEWFG